MGQTFWIQMSVASFFIWSIFLSIKLEDIQNYSTPSTSSPTPAPTLMPTSTPTPAPSLLPTNTPSPIPTPSSTTMLFSTLSLVSSSDEYIAATPETFIRWSLVFIPCWVFLLLLFVVDENFLSHKHTFHTPIENPPNYYVTVLPINIITATLIFSVLEVLHLEGAFDDKKWKVRYLPFWYLIIMIVVLVLTKIHQTSNKVRTALWSTVGLAPVVIFLILLYFYLVGTISSLAVVCIPLFVIEVVLWFLACIFPLSGDL